MAKKARTTRIALVAGVGIFLSTLDSGIINIAIPSLIKVFHSNLNTVIWTITLYTLSLSASILLFGKLADKLGRLTIYQIGLTGFALSSLLCGLSPNMLCLILARCLQGLSAAMLQATAIAIITSRLHGHDRHKALGTFGILLGLGPTMGPVVGGFILSHLSWHWIFYINMPICLLGIIGGFSLPAFKESLHKSPIYKWNMLLLALSLLSLLIALHSMNSVALVFFLVVVTLFTLKEKRTPVRLLPYHKFLQLNFSVPMLGIIAFGGATAISFMLPPLYFTKLCHLAPYQIGLISLSAPIGLVISAKVAGHLVKHLGTMRLMIAGFCLMLIALGSLSRWQLDWPIPIIFSLLLLYGLGGGLFQTPCVIHLTEQFDSKQQALISSLIRMIQNLSIGLCSALAVLCIGTSFVSNQQLLIGLQHTWMLAALLALLTLLSLILLLIKEKTT